MRFSDDLLIEYLMGETPDELNQLIEAHIAIDDALRRRVETLREALEPTDQSLVFEPPGDLVESTMRAIELRASGAADAQDTNDLSSLHVAANAPGSLKTRESAVWGLHGSRVMWDSAVLFLSLSILCFLVLPAILRIRFESRRWQCVDRLRNIGWQLFDYATNVPDARLPRVYSTGPYDFAGVYSVHLSSFGHDVIVGNLLCPDRCESADAEIIRMPVPSFHELETMGVADTIRWRELAGGDYAYCLGVYEQGSVKPPRYDGNAYFAVIADAPRFIDRQGEAYLAHDGKGINVLYEDGCVRFLPNCVLEAARISDHPFRNHEGIHAAGLFENDASLAPSQFSPLGHDRPNTRD